jgi:hypothetical protein
MSTPLLPVDELTIRWVLVAAVVLAALCAAAAYSAILHAVSAAVLLWFTAPPTRCTSS